MSSYSNSNGRSTSASHSPASSQHTQVTQPASQSEPDLTDVEIETREGQRRSSTSQHPVRRPAVPGLFPRRSVNLLIGSIGSGKTTLALHELERYHASGQFLTCRLPEGQKPDQCGAICCSGTLESLYDRITALDLEHLADLTRFPIRDWQITASETSIADTLGRLHDELSRAARRTVHLLLIEGLQLMMPDGKVSDLHAVREFYRALGQFCLDRDVTILGTVGSPKARRGETYPVLGDRCYGSIAWGQEASTLIGVEVCRPDLAEEQRPRQRRVVIQVRAKADIEVVWTLLQPDGRLDVLERPEGDAEVLAGQTLAERLRAAPAGSQLTMRDFLDWGAGQDMSRRTVERWLTGQVALGMLVRQGSNRDRRFVKPSVQ